MLQWWYSYRSALTIHGAWLVLGLVIGFGVFYFYDQSTNASLRGRVVRLHGYEFISPLLACDIGQEEVFTELNPLRHTIESAVNAAKSQGEAKSISVYLRTLNSGRWLEVNGDEKYTPASLLKVIIMIGYFKEAEDNPQLLQRSLVFNLESSSENGARLIVGKSYRIDELIREMIVHSNNDALHLLLSRRDTSSFDGIYKDLNIQIPEIQTEERLNIMDPVSYSMVFRVLYGATYLNRTMSEHALELLSEADDTGGLAAGVPETIVVAHKFGLRRSEGGEKEIVELHDCGIVYYPEHPYLLCIMTRGNNETSLHGVVTDLSRDIYQGIDVFFKN